jgi:hypothetical protein
VLAVPGHLTGCQREEGPVSKQRLDHCKEQALLLLRAVCNRLLRCRGANGAGRQAAAPQAAAEPASPCLRCTTSECAPLECFWVMSLHAPSLKVCPSTHLSTTALVDEPHSRALGAAAADRLL